MASPKIVIFEAAGRGYPSIIDSGIDIIELRRCYRLACRAYEEALHTYEHENQIAAAMPLNAT